MKPPRVLEERQLWSRARLCVISFLWGLLAVPCMIALVLLWPPTPVVSLTWHLALAIACTVGIPLLVFPIRIMIHFRHHIRSASLAKWFGAAFAAGAYGPVLLSALVMSAYRLDPSYFLVQLLVTLLLAVLGTYGGLVAWKLVVRRLPHRVIIQDGTYCPGCAYRIIGNTSGVCPECGQAVDHLTGPRA